MERSMPQNDESPSAAQPHGQPDSVWAEAEAIYPTHIQRRRVGVAPSVRPIQSGPAEPCSREEVLALAMVKR